MCSTSKAHLGIDSDFRTIDIDTAAQVHRIGGRVTEALSTSLSVHGAHEEALRRIEHYSMTSMHSSAHSIRSMDSIRTEFRTELSRLEAMISNTSIAIPSGIETGESQNSSNLSPNVRRYSDVAETGNGVSHPPVPGPLPGHGQESSTTTGPGIELATQVEPSNLARNEAIGGAQLQRIGNIATGNRTKTDLHKPSKDNGTSMGVIDDEATGEVNKASDLYAEFSKSLEPRRTDSSAVEIDSAAIHDVLRQSLSSIYPPEVVKYISIWQVTTLCEDHMDFLDRKPSVQRSGVGNVRERSVVESLPRSAARPSMAELRERLVELRKAIKVSRKQCIQAGYTLYELDKLLSPPGTGSCSPADRPPRRSEMDSGDDSSSVHSEDFHSPAE